MKQLRWALGLLAFTVASASTPPPGFVETLLVSNNFDTGAVSPTGIAYEPGTNHLWVLEKGDASGSPRAARVRVRNSSSGAISTAITLDCVDHFDERGLLGIAFSPAYLAPGGASRFVYLYYTRFFSSSGTCNTGADAGSRNRVSRFRESGGTLSSEEVLLEGPYLSSAGNHNGGTLRFAPDGTLFISMGDNDTDADPNPASRNLNDLRGKMLRINANGTIPLDNPFFGTPGARAEIWAWGFRNPFRFNIDPQNGAVYIGDVGEDTWEEIDLGIPGADYGYPCYEGDETFRTCNPPSTSPVFPIFVYAHGGATPPVAGSSVTGGTVYRGTAFPAAYQGNYFFGDFVASWVRRGRLDANNRLVDVQVFLPDATAVVNMAVSPAGCLTWVSIGGAGVRDVCYETDLVRADIDGSLRVDGFDLARLARAFGSACLDPRYDLQADLDQDCAVDGDDLAILAAQFGRSRTAS